mgnify:CR=1 FL=1
MNLSLKSEYALRAVFELACQVNRDPVRIAGIADRQKIPQKFLELILAGLKQGGFVESRRGAEGGYMLARAAERITVGEVLRQIEGQRAPLSAQTCSFFSMGEWNCIIPLLSAPAWGHCFGNPSSRYHSLNFSIGRAKGRFNLLALPPKRMWIIKRWFRKSPGFWF